MQDPKLAGFCQDVINAADEFERASKKAERLRRVAVAAEREAAFAEEEEKCAFDDFKYAKIALRNLLAEEENAEKISE
jgi:hypothetical protein